MLRTHSAYDMSNAEVPTLMPRNQSEDNLLTTATKSYAPVPKPRPRTQVSLDSSTSPTWETGSTTVEPSLGQNGSIPDVFSSQTVQEAADRAPVPGEELTAIPAVRPVVLAQNLNHRQPPVPKPRKDLIKSVVEPCKPAPAASIHQTGSVGSAESTTRGSVSELYNLGMEIPSPPPSSYLGDPGSPPSPPPIEDPLSRFSQQNGVNGPIDDATGPAVPPRPKTGPTAPPVIPTRSAPPPPVPPRRDLINK